MKNFKYILISSIIIYGLTFLAHFTFDILQNDIIAVFFPTNESIFQHMKMIFTCYFIFYFILFIVRRKFKFQNVFLANLVASISCIAFFLVIYIPTYLRFGEHMIFTFILLFVAIMFGQYIASSFLKKNDYKQIDIFSIILISIIFVILGYLTFNPIENFIFWDPQHETYDIVSKGNKVIENVINL